MRFPSPTTPLWLVLVGCITQGCDAGREAETPDIVSSVQTSGVATISSSGAATVQTPRNTATLGGVASTPDGEPDDAGYFTYPSIAVRGRDWVEYVPLEHGPFGSFLTDLQDRLAAHDEAWLTTLVAGEGPSLPTLELLGLDGAKLSETVEAHAVADGLAALFAAGSSPIVQGYYAQRGAEHVYGTHSADPVDLAAIDTLHVVVTGWIGTAPTLSVALPSPVPSTAVWRFERNGADWRWTRWRWASDGSYTGTLVAALSVLNNALVRSDASYNIVRPASRWPTPAALATRTVPSPDGAWTAIEVGGPHQPIEPRDPKYSRMFVGVEVEHLATGETWWPIELWESGDKGSALAEVIGWRPNSAQVVVAKVVCGGGCVLSCGHWLSVFDGESGTTRSLTGPLADPTLDPTGRFVASFGYEAGEPPRGAIVVADLYAGTVVSATFPAETQSAIAWAPDGSALAFSITDRYAICAEHPASHLARFEIATGEVSVLTPVDDRHRRVRRWNADDTLEVAVFDDGPVWFDRHPDATELRDARSGALLAETVTGPTPDASTAP